MKNYRLLIFLLLSLSTITAGAVPRLAWAANTDIIINEIAAYPTSGQEWVEIFNKGADVVDLKNWKFWENDTNHSLTPFCKETPPCATTVAAGAYAVIVQDPQKFLAANTTFAGQVFDSSWTSLNETGEDIGLKDAKGIFVEHFTYVPAPKNSLERRSVFWADYTKTNWQEHLAGNTVGKINSNFSDCSEASQCTATLPQPDIPEPVAKTSPAATSNIATTQSDDCTATNSCATATDTLAALPSPIILNELYPYPRAKDEIEEFIEIKNRSNEPVNLVVWKLADSKTSITLGGELPANGLWALPHSFTGITLGNTTAEKVRLLTPAGAVADEVNYPKAEAGLSYGRDDTGAWSWSAIVTKGAPNESADPDAGGVIWNMTAPKMGEPGEQLIFDASESVDPRGGELNYSWNFGDGVALGGDSVDYIFANAGSYMVTVKATSSAGTSDFKKLTVTVAPGLLALETAVSITEILPNPAGADGKEFIEIYNASDNSIDLSGWKLRQRSGKAFTILDKTTIAPRAYSVFYRAATHLSLDNGGDTVELVATDNRVASSVKFTATSVGNSYSLLGENWHWTAHITPGAPNGSAVLGEKIIGSGQEVVGAGTMGQTPTAKNKIGAWQTVTGVVAAVPGTFGTQYLYLLSDAVNWQIYSAKKLFPALVPGDVVQVRGQARQKVGVPRLALTQTSDFRILTTSSTPPEPKKITLDDLDDQLLGSLVSISGEITELKTRFAYLDDGSNELQITFKPSAHIDTKALHMGGQVEITGILEQTKTGWQLWPRNNQDIAIVSGIASKNQTNQRGITTPITYGLVSTGGVLLLIVGYVIHKRAAKLPA